LIGIAINKIRQFWQKLAHENSQTLADQIVIDTPDNDSEKVSGLIKHLDQILEQLPSNHRQVLQQRFIEGNSIKQTAENLNLSSENVRVLQHRALKQATALAQEFIK
jgi:RNA polymerase sigma-70 factor (ECF subfamily)